MRTPRTQTANSTTGEVPRDHVLAAAGRCIERYGIDKTTMGDIAREAGMSRPSVYRYFADRDDLLVALISQRSRALREKAHKFIGRQDTLPDQIVEGLLYLADHGRRDPFTRHLLNLDGTSLGQRMAASRTSETLTAEFWDPFLDAAIADKQLPVGISRPDIHLWLANLGLMLMRGLEEGDADIQRYRSILRRFVAPAFTV
ncbi:TetR/AcrR family transcriptional regulator [Streptomyces sp. NPDC001982]|uniref:TetR/AcrR family transcriptional regulator n=1 Tax=Streptomyces sp. NPDC001982 TaxID=3154405 RepID=UPI003321A21B